MNGNFEKKANLISQSNNEGVKVHLTLQSPSLNVISDYMIESDEC